MYIQPPIREPTDGEPYTIPRGYSGTAFREEALMEERAHQEPPLSDDAPTPSPAPPEPEESKIAEPTEESVPVFSNEKNPRDGGIFSRIPFLSSLLPPPRGSHKGERDLSEWITLGLVALLVLDPKEEDLLPFLMALLLWE